MITDSLNKLKEIKSDIKEAIINKGVEVGDKFEEYAAGIDQIKGGKFVVPSKIRFAHSKVSEFPEDWDWTEIENEEDCSYLFYQAPLIKCPNIQLKKVKNLTYAFYNCKLTDIDTTGWDTSNLTNLSNTFYLSNITTVPKIDTSNVTNFENAFQNCPNLIKVEEINTSKGTNISSIFGGCSALKDLCELDATNHKPSYVSEYNSPVYNCHKLRNFGGLKGISTDFYVRSSKLLSYESLVNIINGLADGVSGKTVYFDQNCVNMLSDEDIAIATSKGWSISPAKSITAPIVVTNLSQIPSNIVHISRRVYDLSQYTGSWGKSVSSLLPCSNYIQYFDGDLSSSTNLNSAFYSCPSIIDVRLTNTSNITEMNCTFMGCSNLENLYIENTSNVTSMDSLFGNCYKLREINLSE